MGEKIVSNAPSPSGGDLDFQARLRQLLAKSKASAETAQPPPSPVAGGPPASASRAPPGDEFQSRLAAALVRARGVEPVAEPPPADGTVRAVSSGAELRRIAQETGQSAETIWNHPSNRELREQRGTIDALQPGDEVFIPEDAPEEVVDAESVGQGDYEVRPGDCMSSIANEHGFFWETLWNDPSNAELRDVRKNPNILLPEDRVTIRPLISRDEPIPAEQRHTFVRLGEPEVLRMKLVTAAESPSQTRRRRSLFEDANQEQRSRGNIKYVVNIDGREQDGITDPEGNLELFIPGNAREGFLVLTATGERFPLQLGKLPPIESLDGVRRRLSNLGFDCNDEDGEEELGPKTRAMLEQFQRFYSLEISETPDEATRARLVDEHGS